MYNRFIGSKRRVWLYLTSFEIFEVTRFTRFLRYTLQISSLVIKIYITSLKIPIISNESIFIYQFLNQYRITVSRFNFEQQLEIQINFSNESNILFLWIIKAMRKMNKETKLCTFGCYTLDPTIRSTSLFSSPSPPHPRYK